MRYAFFPGQAQPLGLMPSISSSSAQATHKQDELGTMGLGVRLPLLRLEELSLEGGGLIRRQVIPEHVSQLGESDATEPSRHVAP